MYLNEAQISLTGYVATQPLVRSTPSGAMNVSMRVAWTPRRQDRVTGEWADGNTSYVTVICWRKLASNAGVCLRKGDPVVVKGRLSIREFDDKQGLRRTAVEVEATSVGHDLSRGVAQFQRVRPQTGMTAMEYAAAAEAAARSGVPEGAGAAGNGLAAANGPAAVNGTSSANGQPVGRAAGGAEDRVMLELTQDGFSPTPGSMDDGADSDQARLDPTVSDEDVEQLIDEARDAEARESEAREAEQSRDLEPIGAPF